MSLVGKLNRYTCDFCQHSIVTVDRDEGTTPFMIDCKVTVGCGGYMKSSFYKNVEGPPAYEWRKPTKKEYKKASHAMQQHFDMGGLDIHPIQAA